MNLEFVTELALLTASLKVAPYFAIVPILAALVGSAAAAVSKDVFA